MGLWSRCGPREDALGFADSLPLSGQVIWCHIQINLFLDSFKMCSIHIIFIIYACFFWIVSFRRFLTDLSRGHLYWLTVIVWDKLVQSQNVNLCYFRSFPTSRHQIFFIFQEVSKTFHGVTSWIQSLFLFIFWQLFFLVSIISLSTGLSFFIPDCLYIPPFQLLLGH